MPSNDPDAVREEIERTRMRMSGTLDEIEELIVRKKEEIRDRLDIGARIRENPLQTAGIVLGAGLLLGFLSGGEGRAGRAARARAAAWEQRARRLLEIARRQEQDIEELQSITDVSDPWEDPGVYRGWYDDSDDIDELYDGDPFGREEIRDAEAAFGLDDDDEFDGDDREESYLIPDTRRPRRGRGSIGQRLARTVAEAAGTLLDSLHARR